MIVYESNVGDTLWLGFVLKRELKWRVSIENNPLFKGMLIGKYFGSGDPVPFFIKYSSKEFLRITVTGDNIYAVKKEAINDLAETLMPLTDQGGEVFGHPLASFNFFDGEYLDPYYEWALINREEYARELINGTLITDASPQDLVIYNRDGSVAYSENMGKQFN